jgi:Leucine Rich repeat
MRPWLARILRSLRPSLRVAMVAVLIVGLGLGWIVNQARTRHAAVAAIDRAGGGIRYDWQNRADGLFIEEPKDHPWLRRQLGPDYFDRIMYVNFSGNAADALMSQVGRLTSLEELDLSGSDVTDAGIAHLSGLVNLRSLALNDTKATSASFASLTRMKDLGDLSFYGIRCDDGALARLGQLTALQVLRLSNCPITDAGMVHIEKLQELQVIGLTGTAIGDAGISHLEKCLKLQGVFLDGTKVTRNGVARLAGLPDLEIIEVRETALSAEQVEALRQAHPNVAFNR